MSQLSDKGRRIREMFDGIAPRYDLLNRLLSLGIDRRWRTFAVARLQIPANGRVLDIATGTGDVALEVARQTPPSVRIVGEDFTQGMLVRGRDKIAASAYADRIDLVNAPCEAIPHPSDCFDGVTIAFGIRNVVDRPAGLREMCRVLKPGGRAVILEFSNPRSRVFREVYYFYFRRLLPFIGGLLSRRSAYQYLPDSVLEFPSQEQFCALMAEAGFVNIRHHDRTGGIVTVYVGEKPR
ncbi:bifunctional demethylmenaquinone methyltransferase/2-methoxy-6-polyprenyl-1,4-benzoquinol methylase UbiE [Geoalkalibacter halelectricus]|uniref:Demethylmenaquinone methyltransferase n=1 Tax=Geoalkalibacter halelectricus TaxID=2847045 RepID=A0ABY5ZQ35_9BACT|nr:bifunctional demethylmenaquinone methyltransferase/2-methoxy-6-polyprenyl-1,4-benzoquinol methylase UbiE [Geoalkalibacter halelectricus]MDO3379190.1 bifunctional demethylmenaquinone methyltransferase/2-methoxy-6-polyprenyl-1,4-benzoquinol methylase UbiE [Geoalkalibacter halelectricus]UWZ80949.1 bifunctional demethylmenaquinone methyltransferase/2-methoxy-6-polyprenyl-1,4-benzoquinol methylase UbiE [Geoalkalibacter halelectricus]